MTMGRDTALSGDGFSRERAPRDAGSTLLARREALPFPPGPPAAHSYETVDSRDGRRAGIRTGFPCGHLTGYLRQEPSALLLALFRVTLTATLTKSGDTVLQMRRGCLCSRPNRGGDATPGQRSAGPYSQGELAAVLKPGFWGLRHQYPVLYSKGKFSDPPQPRIRSFSGRSSSAGCNRPQLVPCTPKSENFCSKDTLLSPHSRNL